MENGVVTYRMLVRLGALLDVRRVFTYRRGFHFPLSGGATIVLTADSANRIRVDARHFGRDVATLWSFADDTDRLAGLVVELAEHVESDGARGARG